MIRTIGGTLFILSTALFLTIRRYWGKTWPGFIWRSSQRILFLLGILGLSFLIFGGIRDAVVLLAVWVAVAWAYNR